MTTAERDSFARRLDRTGCCFGALGRSRCPCATGLFARECLDHFVGLRVLDVTSSDPDDEVTFVTLMFEDGSTIRITIESGSTVVWSTTQTCMDHIGCIAGESPVPDPAVLVRA